MRRHGMVALVFCLAVAALTAAGISGSGPNAASIALAPNPLTLSVNDTGSVNVQVSNAQNLGAFEFIIAFDPAVVHASGVTLGPMLTGSGTYTAYLLDPLIDNTAGTVRFAAYTLGTGAGPNGSGVLATMQFQGMSAGTSGLTFTKVRITDRSAVIDAGAAATNGSVVVGSGSGPRMWLPTLRK